jgi:YlmC/YmxH family sporulation protein
MGELVCEVTFCELRAKQVVNVVDGKCLGHIIDLVFDLKCGKVLGLVTPGWRRSFFRFRPREDIFIPWRCVCKIGDDVILVELKPHFGAAAEVLGGARGERRYGAEYETGPAPVKAEAAEGNASANGAEQKYKKYYDIYDIPDKE